NLFDLLNMCPVGNHWIIDAPLSRQIERSTRLIYNDNLRRSESLQALDTDMAQSARADDNNFCPWIEQRPGLLDGVIGSEARVGQSGDIFRLQAGIELDHRTGIRLEEVCHPSIDGDARKNRIATVHIV